MFVLAEHAKTLDTSGLLSTQLGAAWVYADGWPSIWRHLEAAEDVLAGVLEENICFQFGYLSVRARKEPGLRDYGKPLLRFLANHMAAQGRVGKLLSRTSKGTGYATYYHPVHTHQINEVLLRVLEGLERGRPVRFKYVADQWFSGEKGSYYWAKGLLEHLVVLGLATHSDDWSVEASGQGL